MELKWYKMKVMKKTVGPIVILLGIVFGFLFLYPDLHFYFWGDETRQVIPLTISMIHDIRQGTFGFWNWEMGFGATNAMHFLSYLGSPSFWLLYCLPDPQWVINALPLTAFLSLSLAAVFSFLWLSDLTDDELARFAGTVIMTFSGWAIFQFHYYSYLDAWMVLCLLLYGMEEVLQGRKQLLFPVIIALLTVLDLYTMYMASWLILFYMVTRLFMRHGSLSLKEVILHLFRPFLLYLLGLGMAGAVFAMDTVILLSSSRVGGEPILSLKNLFVTPGGFYRILTSMFSPVTNDYDYNLFSSPFKEGTIHTYALFTYSFILCPLLLPQLFVNGREEKKPVRRILILLYVLALIPVFYYVFNGNITSRWSFYYIVFHVLAIVLILSRRSELNQKLLIRSCIGTVVLLLVFTAIALVFHTCSENNRLALVLIIPCLCLACIAYTFGLVKQKRNLFCTVLLLEALLCVCARIVNGKVVTIGKGERALQYEAALLDTSVMDRITAEDQGFYRIGTDESVAENYLLPMAKNFRGNSFYFSLFNPANEAYYHRRITEDWFIPFLPSKMLSYDVFGNTYLVLYDADAPVPAGYELLYETKDRQSHPVRVLHRSSAVTMGYADTVRINAAYAEEADKSLEDYLMNIGVLCETGTQMPQADRSFVSLGTVNNGVIEYAFDEPGTLYLDYSNTEPFGGGSYELYRNGEAVVYREFEEHGYHAVRITEKFDAAGVYAHNTNFPDASIDVHVYWLSDAALASVRKERETKDALVFESEEKGNVRARIKVTGEKKLVASSVPYDPGWKVMVNGTAVKPEIVNTSFIGFELEPGEYEIEFVYTPVGFRTGCAVSVLSLVIYALLGLMKLQKGKR